WLLLRIKGFAPITSPPRNRRLLDLDGRALLLELLLHVLGLGLGDLLLHRLGRAVDQIPCLLEAEPGPFPHHLYDLDLLVAGPHPPHVEVGLLLDGRGATAATPRARHGRNGHGRCRRHAPLLLEQLGELRGVEQRELVELFGDFFDRGHGLSFVMGAGTRSYASVQPRGQRPPRSPPACPAAIFPYRFIDRAARPRPSHSAMRVRASGRALGPGPGPGAAAGRRRSRAAGPRASRRAGPAAPGARRAAGCAARLARVDRPAPSVRPVPGPDHRRSPP